MQIRIECYESEKEAALSAVKACFDVKSVSKGYPNARQTSVQGTPCEYRYYIKAGGTSRTAGLADMLAMDMLRTLAAMSEHGYDASGDVGTLRQVYLSSGSFSDRQLTELFLEWKTSLLKRALGMKGGA